MKDAIYMAKEVDQQSKDEGMQIAEEFYPEISEQADHLHVEGQQRQNTKIQYNSEHTELSQVMQLTQGLRQSIKAVN